LAKKLTEMDNVTREYAQNAARSAQVARDHLNDTVEILVSIRTHVHNRYQ
jgi:hypothetical protein